MVVACGGVLHTARIVDTTDPRGVMVELECAHANRPTPRRWRTQVPCDDLFLGADAAAQGVVGAIAGVATGAERIVATRNGIGSVLFETLRAVALERTCSHIAISCDRKCDVAKASCVHACVLSDILLCAAVAVSVLNPLRDDEGRSLCRASELLFGAFPNVDRGRHGTVAQPPEHGETDAICEAAHLLCSAFRNGLHARRNLPRASRSGVRTAKGRRRRTSLLASICWHQRRPLSARWDAILRTPP